MKYVCQLCDAVLLEWNDEETNADIEECLRVGDRHMLDRHAVPRRNLRGARRIACTYAPDDFVHSKGMPSSS